MGNIVKVEDFKKVGLGGKLPLPKQRYALQCVEEKFGPSNSTGSMMITRTLQLIDPNEITIGGQAVVIAGTEFQQYVTVLVKNKDYNQNDPASPMWDAENSKKVQMKMFEDYSIWGIDVSLGVDVENPPLLAVGKVVDAICETEENIICEAPTPEDIAKGLRQGKPILDADGKKVIMYRPRTNPMLLGLSRVAPQQLAA